MCSMHACTHVLLLYIDLKINNCHLYIVVHKDQDGFVSTNKPFLVYSTFIEGNDVVGFDNHVFIFLSYVKNTSLTSCILIQNVV